MNRSGTRTDTDGARTRSSKVSRWWFRFLAWRLRRAMGSGLDKLERYMKRGGYPRHVRRQVWRDLIRSHGRELVDILK